MSAKVVGVAPKCADDGSHSIAIETDSGEMIEVSVPLPHLEELIRHFQDAAIVRASQAAQNLSFPTLTATSAELAHRGPACELLVSTLQLGSIVLQGDDVFWRRLKHEADRAESYRGGPRSKQ